MLQSADDEGLLFNCANMNSIKLIRELGRGNFKIAYLGEYGNASKVAVKMARGTERCIEDGKPMKRCRYDTSIKLHVEIDISQQLKHPNILRFLGYCFRSKRVGTGSLTNEGLITVYEYAEPFNKTFLETSPIRWRLNAVASLMDLLMYLKDSPMGSLRMYDLRTKHFLIKNGVLKLIDLDGMHSAEPFCLRRHEKTSETRVATMTNGLIKPIACTRLNLNCTDGYCKGFNAVNALDQMKWFMLRYMLELRPQDELDLGSKGTVLVKKALLEVQSVLDELGDSTALAVKTRLLQTISELREL